MSGPIVKAVMAAINADKFDAQFSDYRWRWIYCDSIGTALTAAQDLALAGTTADFHDYCEMNYYARGRASGKLTDEVRAYGILAAAEREITR